MEIENMITYDKITTGYVAQRFDDKGNCVSQEFISSDECTWEYDGYEINVGDMPLAGREYFPFDMQQPNAKKATPC
jgi:hypothetical protein